MANAYKVDTSKYKPGSKYKGPDGKTYYVTEGGHIRVGGAGSKYPIYTGKNVPWEASTTKPKTPAPTTPAAPTPQVGTYNSATGLEQAVKGSAQNPVLDSKSKTTQDEIKKAVGDKFAGNATGALQLYQGAVPLLTLPEEMSPETKNALGILSKAATDAQAKDPNQLAALEMYRKNAEQGLDQPVLTAMKEAGMKDINDQLSQGLRQMQLRAAGNGISGANSMFGGNDLLVKQMAAQGDLANKLLMENKDYMQANTDNFANYSNKVNNDYYSNLDTAGKNYFGASNAADEFLQKTKIYNQGQEQNYGLGELGAIFSGAGIAQGQKTNKDMMDLYKQMIGSASAGMSAFNGSSSPSVADYLGGIQSAYDKNRSQYT